MKDQVIDKDGKEITIEDFHPGVFLKEELKCRNISTKDFAKQIGIYPSNLSNLFKGERHISVNIALRIEEQLNISAEYWLNMQMSYDLYIARQLKIKHK